MNIRPLAHCLALLQFWILIAADSVLPGPPVAQESKLAPLHGPYPIVRVVDGDTLWIALDGRLEKLRLEAVNTEERLWDRAREVTAPRDLHPRKPGTEFGEETGLWAQSYFGQWKAQSEVLLAWSKRGPERDAFGRLICQVFLPDGVHFNLLLVQLGKSPYYKKYGHSSLGHAAFERAEAKARVSKLGIWSDANRARKAAPDYSKLTPWWHARAAAIEHFRHQLGSELEILDADEGELLRLEWEQRACEPDRRVTVFGSVRRFFEESDGSLTAVLNSGPSSDPLRLSIPKSDRDSELEKTLRYSQPKYRQNFLYLSGQLSLGERGITMLADHNSHWRLAGPKPRWPKD